MYRHVLAGALVLAFGLFACGESEPSDPGDPVPSCGAGDTLCGDSCVHLPSDPRHCGGCDVACDAGEVCSDGSCTASCPVGQTSCDGACHDLDTSRIHCGACGNACAAGEVCSDGACATACPDGQVACDGACHDTDTSRAHCGACGNACAAGELCADGGCVLTCPTGQEACDGGCHNLQTSRDHCGTCGTTCGAGEVCADGTCVVTCAGGMAACGGACTDTRSDRANCGACGTTCGASELCVDGSCEVTCATGLAECAGACRDTSADPSNCGGCGVACEAGEVCTAGACVATCGPFAQDTCGGACTNLQVDPANCGACGNACAAGEVCSSGSCVDTCSASQTACSGACTDLMHDPANCGACGNVCAGPAGSIGLCNDGACDAVCLAGSGDCNGDLQASGSDGCETPLLADPENCGGCGIVCANPPNGIAACVSGSCAIAACSTGFDDCNLDPTDGCERPVANDPLNCGFCGNVCALGESCVNGGCMPTPGEDCNSPITVTAGLNVINWIASQQNYLTQNVHCASVSATPVGGDVVLRYDATFNGTVDLNFAKPGSTRWHVIVSEGACGSLTPEVGCLSDYTPTQLTGSFDVRAGGTYYIYVSDTDSGTNVLDNPLNLTLTETGCIQPLPVPTITSLTPADGATTATVVPDLTFVSSEAVWPTTGTIQVTGSLGSNHTLTLPSPQVTFSTDKKTVRILPGVSFKSGETLTISWTLSDKCGSTIPSPPWSVTMPVVPCTPGEGGMVGSTITRIPSGWVGSAPTEYYVAADADPNGWVYVGGTSVLLRTPKAGGMPQDVTALAGLTTSHLGYTMLIDGQSIYTVDDKTSGTTGYLWRISTDGGANWNAPQDVATFPSAPADDFHGVAAHGGRIYLVTHESTSTVQTQIWSVDASGALPALAQLERSFAGYTYCGGLAVDTTYFYTACRIGTTSNYTIVRIARSDGTTTNVSGNLPGSTTNITMHGRDADADGLVDFVYYNEDNEEGHAVCSLHGTPYTSLLYNFGTGTTNYGLGFDPVANALWAWDDDTLEFVKIQ